MNNPEPEGGSWTRHGHPIPGVTIFGADRPVIARCGGPSICDQCAADVRHYITNKNEVQQ